MIMASLCDLGVMLICSPIMLTSSSPFMLDHYSVQKVTDPLTAPMTGPMANMGKVNHDKALC